MARSHTSGRAIAAIAVAAGLVVSPALTSPAAAHTYTVQPGDSLGEIAQRYGTTWRNLYQENSDVISQPGRIYVGQVLDVGDGQGVAQQRDQVSSDGSASTYSGASEQRVLAEARSLEGISYNYGGDRPSEGFDCSGFTSYVFGQAGKTIPRTSGAQAAAATRISQSQLRPGDLIFFTPYGDVSHVAIYAGNGMVWEAPGSGKQVRYAPVWDVSRFYGRL